MRAVGVMGTDAGRDDALLALEQRRIDNVRGVVTE
jgi:hypothetical protein